MKLKTEIDTRDIKDIVDYDYFEVKSIRRALKETIKRYMEEQDDRINSGVDVFGNEFKPYNEDYARTKQGGSWLRNTGSMLASQKPFTQKKGISKRGAGRIEGSVKFTDKVRAAYINNAWRKYIGFTNSQSSGLINHFQRLLARFWNVHKK